MWWTHGTSSRSGAPAPAEGMPKTPSTYGAALLLAACLTTVAWAAAWEEVPWNAPAAKKKQPPGINAIALLDRNKAWLGTSDGRLLHWDGVRLSPADHPAKVSPRKFVVNADDDVWVFGDDALSLHYDGKDWTRVDNPLTLQKPSQGRLWGAGCAAPDRCFAGTRDGRLIEWDGSKWRNARSPVDDERIHAMQFSSRDSGWMVGDGFFARWDGKSWKKADMKDVPRMYDLAVIGDDWGWAVGDHGVLFRYDGAAWKQVDVPASLFRLRAVACASREDCWAVGEAGAVLGWNGARWQRSRLGTPDRLTAVAMKDGTALLAGDRGTLFRRGPAGGTAAGPSDTP